MVIDISFNGVDFILGQNTLIKIEGKEYNLSKTIKGVNSLILLGVSPQDYEEIAIKISKYAKGNPPIPTNKSRYVKRYKRFIREIEAMQKAKDSGMNASIVELYQSDHLSIPIIINGNEIGEQDFPYFSMEYAEETLDSFLSNDENELTLQQKIVLFREILKCFNDLHAIGIYHRDIKPANIFRFGKCWKIGDLGLIAHRDEDEFAIDYGREKIGPVGRLSPEATNKCLGNIKRSDYNFDNNIDIKSDMYQLGLLFWYICQGEVPAGNLKDVDFRYHDVANVLYSDILLPLLQYSKERRIILDIARFDEKLEPIKKQLAL